MAMLAVIVVGVVYGRQRSAARRSGLRRTRAAGVSGIVLATLVVFLLSITVGGAALFGLNTTCTNYYDCTESDCGPCGALGSAALVLIVGEPLLAATIGIAHWRYSDRRYGRVVLPVGVVLVIGFAVAVLWWMTWWTGVHT
jgi:hypothetical protein